MFTQPYYYQFKVVLPAAGKPLDAASIERGVKILKASLNKVENIFLKDTPFIYSDHMTIADLLGVCELMQPTMGVGIDVETNYPKVTQWVSHVRDSVGPELFDEAHKFIKLAQKAAKTCGYPTPKL